MPGHRPPIILAPEGGDRDSLELTGWCDCSYRYVQGLIERSSYMKSKDESNSTNYSFPYSHAQLFMHADTHMHHVHAIMYTTYIIQTIYIMHIHVKGAKNAEQKGNPVYC